MAHRMPTFDTSPAPRKPPSEPGEKSMLPRKSDRAGLMTHAKQIIDFGTFLW
jgi:hypothetical protein